MTAYDRAPLGWCLRCRKSVDRYEWQRDCDLPDRYEVYIECHGEAALTWCQGPREVPWQVRKTPDGYVKL